MRTVSSKFRLLSIVAGLVSLVSCSSEPTSESGDPSFATTTTYLTVSGPNIVTAIPPTTYTYQAYMGASYPNFLPWGVRKCPTNSITSCTVPWSTVYGTTIDTYYSRISQTLAEDCSGGGTRTFQVRAQASAFAVPTQTAYKVTALCANI
jgi:hypothetical protein